MEWNTPSFKYKCILQLLLLLAHTALPSHWHRCHRPSGSAYTFLCSWVSALACVSDGRRTANSACSDNDDGGAGCCTLWAAGRTGDCDNDSTDDEKTADCEWLAVSSDDARDVRWPWHIDVNSGLHRSWCSCTIARRSSSEHTIPPVNHPTTTAY